MSAPSCPDDFVSVADHNIRPAIDEQCDGLLHSLLENGGGCWFVPPGIYFIEETTRLSSGTTLLLHPDARLRLADGAAKDEWDYQIPNANPAGGDRDILIEDVTAHSCHSFVRLLSVVSPIENTRICGLRGGGKVAALNADGARGSRAPVFDESNPPCPDGVGLLRSFHVKDLRVHKTMSSHAALIDLQERLEDVQITGFEQVVQHDAAPSAPSLRLRHLILRQGEEGGKMLSKVSTLPPNPPFEDFLTGGDLRLNPT